MKNGTRLVALLVALLLLARGCSIIKIGQDSSNGDAVVLAEMTDGQVTLAQAQAEFDEVLAYYESYGVALDLSLIHIENKPREKISYFQRTLRFIQRNKFNPTLLRDFNWGLFALLMAISLFGVVCIFLSLIPI